MKLDDFAQSILHLNNKDTLEPVAKSLEQHPDFRVLRRFQPVDRYHAPSDTDVSVGILLDTETTGKDPAIDKLIELGMVKFEYCAKTGRVFSVLEVFNALEDPGMPIPEAASAVNGIFDAEVKGKAIDDAAVAGFIAGADLIVAHNAEFDRQIVERRFPLFTDFAWGCSLRQVDWAAQNFGSQKLDYLAYRLGFFFDAHRAVADCRATLHVLQSALPIGGHCALSEILQASKNDSLRIWALDARFEKKDDLKNRGYRWADGSNGTEKAWNIEIEGDDENYLAEVDWLRQNIYSKKGFRLAVDVVSPLTRFSARPGRRTVHMC